MPYTPLGKFSNVMKQGNGISASQIRGGIITAQELIIAGGTSGVIRSQNYSPADEAGWAIFGDGSAFFYGNVFFGQNAIFQGDLFSVDWDGGDTLAGGQDTTATQGFFLDSSEGTMQLMGGVWSSAIAFMDASNNNAQVGAIGGSNDELLIAGIGTKNVRVAASSGGQVLMHVGGNQVATFNTSQIVFDYEAQLNASAWITPSLTLGPLVGASEPQLTIDYSSGFRLITSDGASGLGSLSFRTPATRIIDFWVGGVEKVRIHPDYLFLAGAATGAPALKMGAGTEAAVAYTFAGDGGTGLYRYGAGGVGMSTSGTIRQAWGTTAIHSYLAHGFLSGSPSTPGINFVFDDNTGLTNPSSDQLGLVTGGAVRALVTNSGPAWAMGKMGFAQITSNFGTFTGETTVTGLSVTVHITAGRLYRISSKLNILSSVGGDRAYSRIVWTGVGNLSYTSTGNSIGPADQETTMTNSVLFSIGTTGNQTFHVTAARYAGTGNLTVGAAGTNPAYILVEDLGLA